MKLLIAHDGSECSEFALEDLHRAGLPDRAEARIVSVIEETVAAALCPVETASSVMPWYPLTQAEALPATSKQIETMRGVVNCVAQRVRREHPLWTVDTALEYGIPGPVILDQIKTWKPDLAIMGSHGRHGFSQLMLGSVSHHVLNHSPCAVRISHSLAKPRIGPFRLIVAVDASADAAEAVRAVASRSWPAGTEAEVIGVVDAGVALTVADSGNETGPIRHADEEFRTWIVHAVRDAAAELERAGLQASGRILSGDPVLMILNDAEVWDADCIFLGARGVGTLHRIILGSVSSQVAARAHCSVEVIRRPAKT